MSEKIGGATQVPSPLEHGKQHPPATHAEREASAKEYRDAHRAKSRKERRAALVEIRKVERGNYA